MAAEDDPDTWLEDIKLVDLALSIDTNGLIDAYINEKDPPQFQQGSGFVPAGAMAPTTLNQRQQEQQGFRAAVSQKNLMVSQNNTWWGGRVSEEVTSSEAKNLPPVNEFDLGLPHFGPRNGGGALTRRRSHNEERRFESLSLHQLLLGKGGSRESEGPVKTPQPVPPVEPSGMDSKSSNIFSLYDTIEEFFKDSPEAAAPCSSSGFEVVTSPLANGDENQSNPLLQQQPQEQQQQLQLSLHHQHFSDIHLQQQQQQLEMQPLAANFSGHSRIHTGAF